MSLVRFEPSKSAEDGGAIDADSLGSLCGSLVRCEAGSEPDADLIRRNPRFPPSADRCGGRPAFLLRDSSVARGDAELLPDERDLGSDPLHGPLDCFVVEPLV